jgi:hypothetical protein
VEFLRPFSQFGIHIPALESVPAQPLNDLSWRLVTADLWDGPGLAEALTGQKLAIASLVWDLPLDALIDAARPLRAWGVVRPDLDALPRGLVPKKHLRDLLLANQRQLRPYSAAFAVTGADLWEQSLDRALETLRPWIGLLFGKPLPPTPFTMDRCLKYLLSTRDEQLWTDALSAWDLAVTAHRHENDPAEYLAALDQLAQFGVDVGEAKAFALFCQNQS